MSKKKGMIFISIAVVAIAGGLSLFFSSKNGSLLRFPKNLIQALRSPKDIPIPFEDEDLKDTIIKALRKQDDSFDDKKGYVTAGECQKLTELFIWDDSITSIKGIEYCTGLQDLKITSRHISDISPLLGLTNLKNLDLSGDWVTNGNISNFVSVLQRLPNLTRLDLYKTQITNISSLSKLTNLTVLDLYDNKVADISPLSGLINLKELDLGFNPITDISPLSGLTNLEKLNLNGNQISDISLIARFTNLTELDLGDNRFIKDISPIARLTNLTKLDLHNNQISDISPLSRLTNLTKLDLYANQITDISPLSGLTNLTELDLCFNQISDISPLSGLTRLEKLGIGANQITDLSPLLANYGLGKGDRVYLGGNPIITRSAHSALKQIQKLEDRGVDIVRQCDRYLF